MVTVIYNLSTALWEKMPKALKDAVNKLNLKIVTVEEVRDKHDYLVVTAAAYITIITEIIRAY